MTPPHKARICAYQHCENPIETVNDRAIYCRRKCKEAAKQQRIQKERAAVRASRILTCVDCGSGFVQEGRGRKRLRCDTCHTGPIKCQLCGRECRPAAGGVHCIKCKMDLKAIEGGPLEAIRECHTCGEPFVGTARVAMYCTDRCARTAYRYRDNATWQARRAAEYGVSAEQFLPTEIFERDGWVCKLCGIPVNPDTVVPHPFAPTIDHVVPLVHGGAHTRENTQCAHFYCNSIKTDAADPEARLGIKEIQI